ncbi:hypothetical protein CEQ90_16515 [Lewinellaceae bacterium SD302]|nr:hypothetical protein CEQ90_16515 [Lewinellaceae bacterium SD302]
MLNFPTYILRLWRYLKNSIALIPGLYVAGFITFYFFVAYLESIGLSSWMKQENAFWLISSEDTARTILGSIIGGLISLTVFSFSMVMVVLSQATSTLSPRLLPQLIRDRSHQTVLGIYLGVIIFTYLTLIDVDPTETWNISGFTVFLCVVMAIVCLAFFVYFIASISQRIQVGRVILRVRSNARLNLKIWKSAPEGWSVTEQLPSDIGEWPAIKARHSGYIDLPLYDKLTELSAEYETEIYLPRFRSAYVLEGTPLIRLSRQLNDKEREELSGQIHLSPDDITEMWYLPAIRHITEVAVKAMSPGINDPGTALESIDMITDILSGMLEIPLHNTYENSETGGRLYFLPLSFQKVLRMVMQELRCYSKSDPIVMQRLALALFQLRRKARSDKEIYTAIDQEISALEEDGHKNLSNSYDRDAFRLLLSRRRSQLERLD